MKTSARNVFRGKVTSVKKGMILEEVVLETSGGHTVVAVITDDSARSLGVEVGKEFTAIAKAPLVILAKADQAAVTSARNRFLGTITAVEEGQVAVEVTGRLDDGTAMCSIITRESVKNLDLKVGGRIWFLIKAFSVILVAD